MLLMLWKFYESFENNFGSFTIKMRIHHEDGRNPHRGVDAKKTILLKYATTIGNVKKISYNGSNYNESMISHKISIKS